MKKLKQKEDSDEDGEMEEIREAMSKDLKKVYKKGDKTVCITDKSKLT